MLYILNLYGNRTVTYRYKRYALCVYTYIDFIFSNQPLLEVLYDLLAF